MSVRPDWLKDFETEPPHHGAEPAPIRACTLAGKSVVPLHWVVENMIPGRTVTLLSGDGGLGKSLLATMLACSVALGRDWLGKQTSAGGVLYVSAEDEIAETHRRLDAISRSWGVDLADLDALRLVSFADSSALMAMPGPGGILAPTPLFRVLEGWISSEPPALVILDTAADIFGGAENDRAQVRAFVQMLRALAITHDCAVLLLSHPSLEGMRSGSGLSGSTAWNNSVRARLYLSRPKDDEDGDARILTMAKNNYGASGDKLRLTWAGGVFDLEEGPGWLDRMAASSKAERVFMVLLRAFAEQGRRVNSSAGPNYAPAAFAAHPDAEGCTRDAFRAAMERLLRAGVVKCEEAGPPSRRVTFLAVAEE